MKFTIFKNQLFGSPKWANDIHDLLDNKMSNKDRELWSHIQFKDAESNTIQITREFLEDQDMSIDEIIQDWKEHGQLDLEILSI